MRIIPSSLSKLRDLGICACAAVALAVAFPKIGAAWIVPLAMAALFWCWQGSSPKRAALLGWVSGMIFFSIDYAWVGHTVGSMIGPYGPFLPLGPALFEAPYFAIAAALATIAYRRARPDLAPLAVAAAFTICEWLRSIGILAAPFDQLGYTQADSPLRAIAAYAGTYGITFVLCVLGAYLADALRRKTYKPLAIAVASTIAITVVAWIAWPARTLAPPQIPVAAVQGNIAQSLKWNNLNLAVDRYTMMTRVAAARHPGLVVWPETVIPTTLSLDQPLMNDFRALSREAGATIVVGAIDIGHDAAFNALYIFQPSGYLDVYFKRQLVPFAESFPGQQFLGWLPYVGQLSGRFHTGVVDGVYPTASGLSIAPMICWESAFADLAYAQIRNGAQLLVVSTDDAWFGTTSGPYMHAQISQLRAIETGAYVIRAAATGVSGIVAPDGTWQTRSQMEQLTTVYGKVGPRLHTVFSRIGPTPVMIFFVLFYFTLLVYGPSTAAGPSTALANARSAQDDNA